jgi:dipeptidyl aminopeptidase/acylaminoacyl peptidase
VISTVVLTLLLYYSLRLIATYLRQAGRDEAAEFPLWRLLIAAALAAVVLSGARQREFPEVRPHAWVVLTDHRRIEGSYVSSDSDQVLIRFRKPGRQPQLLILKRGDVERVLLEKGTYVFPAEESLFGWIFDADFACIPPECRAGDSRLGISSLF